MERKIRALRNGALFQYRFCSEIERKIREDEAAMGQRGIEGGDDDVKQLLGP